jgi:hypothetical protein
MKNAVFSEVAPGGFMINRRFRGMCRLHLQGRRKKREWGKVLHGNYYHLTLFLARVISSTLKMEATCSSETSVYNKPTWHRIAEDSILHSHRHENLKSYILVVALRWSVEISWGFLCNCIYSQTGLGVSWQWKGSNAYFTTLNSITPLTDT